MRSGVALTAIRIYEISCEHALPEPRQATMANLIFLGTGAGDGGTHRNKTSILLEGHPGALLLDAGEPCSQSIQSLGLDREFIRAVFISHTHADHVAGLPALVQDKQVGGRKIPLPLYLPAHLVEPFKLWLEALAMPKTKLGFPLVIEPLEAGKIVTHSGVSILPFPTTHDCQGDRSSFGFVVSKDSTRVVFSADLGAADDLEPVLQEPTLYLICELSHITPESLISVLKDKHIEALLLTHVGEQYLEHLPEIQRQMDAALPGVNNIFTPMDGESFPI
jgi:ribonuclease BN (tRNA processing enzyme)